MTLSIRTRLALWSSGVTVCVLAMMAVMVARLHERQAYQRLDEGLADGLETAAAVMRNELDEGLPLPEAAADALAELRIPSSGLAVFDGRGTQLAVRTEDVDSLPEDVLASVSAVSGNVASGLAAMRVRAIAGVHRGQAFRVVHWRTLAALDADRAAVRRATGLAIPIALLLAAGGAWLVARRALRPVARMAAQADRMSHRHLDERFQQGDARDELHVLADAFNRLFDRLVSALREQRRFMADASHQLRTPVSIARTAAEVTLSSPDRSSEEYRDALAVIALQTRRLTRIVNDMFALALADAEAVHPRMRWLYFDEVVDDCVKAARVLGAERRVTIRSRTEGDCQVLGDEDLLRHLVVNLLENAVRHSPDGAAVEVDVSSSGDMVRLAVQDRGPGVPDAARERIFERFVRLESVTGEGGGLGLAIARRAAELHGGTLRVADSGPSGTRFEARLPLAP